MSSFLMIALFILVISFVVLFHELGHFIFAKKAGAKVEEFGLGLPPRIFGKKISKTIYSINLLPLGAFVRVEGENESEGKISETSIQSKSWSKRFLFVAGGIIFNLILAFFLSFSGRIFGVRSFSLDQKKEGESLAFLDVRENFKYIELTVKKKVHTDEFNFLIDEDLINQVLSDYKLGKDTFKIILEDSLAKEITKNFDQEKFHIEEKIEESPAKKARVKNFSEVIGYYDKNGNLIKIQSIEKYKNLLKENYGKKVRLSLKDLSTKEKYNVTMEVPYGRTISGVSTVTIMPEQKESVLEAIKNTFLDIFFSILSIFYGVFTIIIEGFQKKEIPEEISSVVGIFSEFKLSFLLGGFKFIAFAFSGILSLNLAILNLLPIPALDGGHLVFLLVEKIRRGKKLKPEVQNAINLIGFVFLISLMLFVMGRDIIEIAR